jgi:hypothetical protein
LARPPAVSLLVWLIKSGSVLIGTDPAGTTGLAKAINSARLGMKVGIERAITESFHRSKGGLGWKNW